MKLRIPLVLESYLQARRAKLDLVAWFGNVKLGRGSRPRFRLRRQEPTGTSENPFPFRGCQMTVSAARRRLTEAPEDRLLPRDWLALLTICLLAVAIRASVMALLPSILHPDEVMWLEQANRLVNHQGLVPWDFQLGERSWLWPGLIAGFMALGQLFGSPPAAGLGGVSVLICTSRWRR